MSEHARRVVVTGMGMKTPVGLDRDSTWQALLAGTNGIGPVTLCDTADLSSRVAGELKDFDAAQWLDRKEARRMDRFTHLAIAASAEAFEQSGLDLDGIADEVGCMIGSGIGGMATLEAQFDIFFHKGPGRVSPFLVPSFIADMAAGQVSIRFGLRGPNFNTVSACASGADAIGTAHETIRRGDAIAMFAGGSEAAVTRMALAAFHASRALSTKRNDDPEHASRPYDLNRDGFVLGEGAGVLMLEREEDALARGAHIYGELAGVGWSFDAADDAAPDAEGQSLAMLRALRDAELEPEAIDYINAHGTSTQLNDKTETAAIKLALGPENAQRVAISSTKSMTGHLAAGAGGIEAVVSILTIEHDLIPPTINYVTPDPSCDLDIVPNEAREAHLDVVLSNSFGLGGQNASAIFRRYT